MDLCWLIIFAVLLIAEFLTAGALVSVWFSLGALAAYFTARAGANLTVQLAVFIIASLALLILTKPFIKKIVKNDHIPTNVDRLMGKIAIVIETIDDIGTKGAVAIDGKEWSALSGDGRAIEPGSRVKIVDVKGVKLIVEALEGDE